MLSGMAGWVTDVIDALGYVGVALLVALESIFSPIPSEVVLPFAGFVARDGDANLWGMMLAATTGSVIGAWILYGVSAAIGPDRLHDFVVTRGRWLRITPVDVAKTEAFFDRHATRAVLIGRCVPLVRSLISIPAGFRRMNFAAFTIYTALGSLVWNAFLIGAGFLLRDRWHDLEPILGSVQYLVVAILVGLVAWFLVTRFVLRPDPRSTAADPGEPEDDEDLKALSGD